MSKTYQTLSDFQKDYQYDLSNVESFLGEGTYGQVIKAYDDRFHRFVAIKIGKDLMTEFAAAKNLEHRNIAKHEDCFRIPDKNAGVKDYAIMQLYPEGNLSQLLKNKTLTIEQKKELARGILEGLKYLHSQGRIHRDLKPANILIVKKQNKYIPLITDFGLTKVVKESEYVDGSDVELSDGRGTASHKAPEQVEGDKAHFNLDLWAFGVILYEIMLGERPFNTGKAGTQGLNELLRQIKEVVIPEKINTIQQPYQAIIKRCLVKDIHKRVRKANELIDLLGGNLEVATDSVVEVGTDNRRKEKKVKKTPYFIKAQIVIILGIIILTLISLIYNAYFSSSSEPLAGDDAQVIVENTVSKPLDILNADRELFLKTVNDKTGFMNFRDQVIIPFEYDGATNFRDGLAGVKKNGKWGFIDKKNRVIIPFEYENVRFFEDGLSSVERNDKWGFIDKTNKVIIAFEYNNALNFSEGLAAVQKNKWGFIDKTNQVVIPFEYENRLWLSFHEGLAEVTKGGKTFYINKQNQCVKDCP